MWRNFCLERYFRESAVCFQPEATLGYVSVIQSIKHISSSQSSSSSTRIVEQLLVEQKQPRLHSMALSLFCLKVASKVADSALALEKKGSIGKIKGRVKFVHVCVYSKEAKKNILEMRRASLDVRLGAKFQP